MFSLVVLILVISGILLDWISCIFCISAWMAASDFGDSVRQLDGWGLLHWDRYVFFGVDSA